MAEQQTKEQSIGRTSASVEDYIKAVYHLQARNRRASTRDLARLLDVQMASVSGMMKQLHTAGLVDHRPYQGVQLTSRGHALALHVLRRHRLLELFLQRTLDMAWDELHDDAERLEHAVSDRLVDKIAAFLGEPVFDPHGAPIPQSDGTLPALEGTPLSDCPPGHRGHILHVSDKDPDLLRHLWDLGMRIGLHVEVLDKAPFGGTVSVSAAGNRMELGLRAAEQVLVSCD